MRTDPIRSIAAACLALLLMLSGLRLLLPFRADAAAEEVAAYAAEIRMQQSGGSDAQAWVDGTLTPNAGQSAPDFFIMALAAEGGCDLSGYADAMQRYVPQMTAAVAATSKERSALAWLASAGNVPAGCTTVLDANADAQGIMSRVFGLHLLNNGVPSSRFTNEGLVNELLALQCDDGGWSLRGGYGDPDVTAMTMQALAPYQADDRVQPAIARGIGYLSAKQLATGAFQSYGTENAESTAQVWIALSALGIDALRDARFVKNGNTLLDGILQFRLGAGQYAHAAGSGESALAEQQVYLALTAAGLSRSLYLYHGAAPVLPPQTSATSTTRTTVSQTTASAAITSQTGSTGGTASQTAQSASGTASSAGGSSSAQSTGTVSAAEVSSSADATADTTGTSAETTVTAASAVTVTTELTELSTGSVYETLQTALLTTAPPDSPDAGKGKYPYRIPMTAGAAVLFLSIAVFCTVRGKRSLKTYLTIAAGFGIVTAGIWLIRVESPEQFYQTTARTGGTVTMEIRCDVICGREGSERFPADGVIMRNTEFSIDAGENALTLLYDAVKAYGLQIEVDGISGDVVETAYVRGIASLYEMDFGDLSGWTYTVNGERPPVGCGAYTLHDGDRVAWLYTVNL